MKIMLLGLMILICTSIDSYADEGDIYWKTIQENVIGNMVATGCLGIGNNTKYRKFSYCYDVNGNKYGLNTVTSVEKVTSFDMSIDKNGNWVFKFDCTIKYIKDYVYQYKDVSFVFDNALGEKAYTILAFQAYDYCQPESWGAKKQKNINICESMAYKTLIKKPFFQELIAKGELWKIKLDADVAANRNQ